MSFKGNPRGRVLVLQDAASKEDMAQGVPFTGPPGWRLKAWIEAANIVASDLLFCDLASLTGELVETMEVLVPLGEKSLAQLLPGSAPLSKVRGSIYNTSREGRLIKVIPSLHPNTVLFSAQLEPRCRHDWLRIKEEIDNGPYRAPERYHDIRPECTDIKAYYDRLGPNSVVSMDIETWGGSIKCIGFASDERESLVIPTEKSYWTQRTGSELDLAKAWELIKAICEYPCEKIMQNGLFDSWWLANYDIKVQGYVWDTLGMHHALYPRESHSLDFLASMYTKQPYWKDEAKEADEIVKVARQGMDKLYLYNGLDCTVTHEIYQRLKEELSHAGYLEFYKRHYTAMFGPLLRLMQRGVAVHVEAMARMRATLLRDARQKRDDAGRRLGCTAYVFDKTACERAMLAAYEQGITDYSTMLAQLVDEYKPETIERKWSELQDKGISDKILTDYLEGLGLPKSATGLTAKGRMKADNIALRKVQKYYEERKRPGEKGQLLIELVDDVLEHRRKRKLASFLKAEKIDEDNRLRCTYSFNTKTGRLSSRSNPGGTGMNLQNIDRSLRSMFIASPGRLLVEIDLSRAENRVVGALTGVDYMLEAARRPTTGIDVYKERTAGIYSVLWNRDVALEEVDTEMRRLGKEVVLASAYGMRGNTFSDNLLKKLGVTLTPNEAQKLLDADMAKQPALRDWQSDIRKLIMRERYLYTSWGRSVDFLYDRMDDNTYRFAYSYLPQSEIGDLTNQYMLVPTVNAIVEHNLKSDVVMQCHDAIVIDAVPEEIYDLLSFVRRSVERPRVYGQVFNREIELTVPCEFGVGTTWKKSVEWKILPTREEVLTTCKGLLREQD